ncbi:MAG: NAD(P)-binding domain-containing protein [Balneolaceae bacterium]|nr:NAD(P)-binding domain-containing protein [Balneolaceae bacterium]
MNIAIIGHGNVGGTLARGWSERGHSIFIGARNPQDDSVQKLAHHTGNMEVLPIAEAVSRAEVVLVAIPAPAVADLAKRLGKITNKIIIDATNSVVEGPDGYSTGAEALKAITGCPDVVKGFNTTGYENLADPVYGGEGIDMFTAGDSARGKRVVEQLAQELGFTACYDFGGDDKFELIEQFAKSWINLAIMQGLGRDIAFKVIIREA